MALQLHCILAASRSLTQRTPSLNRERTHFLMPELSCLLIHIDFRDKRNGGSQSAWLEKATLPPLSVPRIVTAFSSRKVESSKRGKQQLNTYDHRLNSLQYSGSSEP